MKFTGQFQKKPAASSAPIPYSTGMFRSRPFPTPETQRSPAATPDHEPMPRRNPDYNRMFGVQPKLTVGAPNDVYEQEADRVADQVMSMPDTAVQQPVQRETTPEEEVQTKPLAASITPLVQREAMPEEEEVQTKAIDSIQREEMPPEEEDLQMKSIDSVQREEMPEEEEVQTKAIDSVQREEMPEEEEVQTKPIATLQREEMPEEEEVQTKSLSSIQREDMPEEEEVQTKPALQRSADGSLQAGGSIESRLNSSKGGGSPLPDDVKGFMESRFRTDFSQVRVHTDSEAVRMNRDLNAQAFTHKQDVYFGAGKAPGKDELTAHELTHVVQQNRHTIQTLQRQSIPSAPGMGINIFPVEYKLPPFQCPLPGFKDIQVKLSWKGQIEAFSDNLEQSKTGFSAGGVTSDPSKGNSTGVKAEHEKIVEKWKTEQSEKFKSSFKSNIEVTTQGVKLGAEFGIENSAGRLLGKVTPFDKDLDSGKTKIFAVSVAGEFFGEQQINKDMKFKGKTVIEIEAQPLWGLIRNKAIEALGETTASELISAGSAAAADAAVVALPFAAGAAIFAGIYFADQSGKDTSAIASDAANQLRDYCRSFSEVMHGKAGLASYGGKEGASIASTKLNELRSLHKDEATLQAELNKHDYFREMLDVAKPKYIQEAKQRYAAKHDLHARYLKMFFSDPDSQMGVPPETARVIEAYADNVDR